MAYPQSQAVVAAIWAHSRARLACCGACCVAWHAAQQELRDELQQLQQLERAHHRQQHQHPRQQPAGQLRHDGQQRPAEGGTPWGAAADARRDALAAALPAMRRLDAERLQHWLEAGAAHVLGVGAAGGGVAGGAGDGGGGGDEGGGAVDGVPADEVLALALQETLMQ